MRNTGKPAFYTGILADMTGWGEPDAGGSAASLPSQVDLGGGHTMRFNPEFLKALARSPAVREALAVRGQQLADTANSMADSELTAKAAGPLYQSKPPDGEHNVALVEPAEWFGVVDDATNNTLYKAMSADPAAVTNPGAQPPNVGPGWGNKAQETHVEENHNRQFWRGRKPED